VVQIKWTVNRDTAAIWKMFRIVCVWWWYFSRLLNRTAEVHMKTIQTEVVFLKSYAKRWLGSNSNTSATPTRLPSLTHA